MSFVRKHNSDLLRISRFGGSHSWIVQMGFGLIVRPCSAHGFFMQLPLSFRASSAVFIGVYFSTGMTDYGRYETASFDGFKSLWVSVCSPRFSSEKSPTITMTSFFCFFSSDHRPHRVCTTFYRLDSFTCTRQYSLYSVYGEPSGHGFESLL